MTFPDNLKATRELCRLTQAELAARLGCTMQTVSNWECGRTAPWEKQLLDVESVLAELRRTVKPRRIIDRILS